MARSGNLFIVSGPSGAGKSLLAARVMESVPYLRFSVSYTTRPARGLERDGVEYHFVTRAAFEMLKQGGELLEWAEVYGNLYGTSKSSIDAILQRGEDVLLDIDVQGAQQIRGKRPEAVSIFILPPSFQVLRARLENRRLDKEYVIAQRLRIAAQEIAGYRSYDYLIINQDLDRSSEELQAIILATRCRTKERATTAESIVDTFGGLDSEDT